MVHADFFWVNFLEDDILYVLCKERGIHMAVSDWNMKTFMKGASILTISALLVKLLGAVYRVPFQNMVGDQGFYIYQQVYPFVGIFIVWTSYGFAVAVSKLLASSQSPGESRALMHVTWQYLMIVSASFFMLLWVASPMLAQLMGDEALTPLLRTSAYIVWVMPFLAVLKGVFQSTGQMVPVAVSGVGEQAFRVVIILVGSWVVVHSGASLYRAGEVAMWGAVAGETMGVLILAFYFRKMFQHLPQPCPVNRRRVIKELTLISISVSISSLIFLLFQLVDSFTVYRALLAKGFAPDIAMSMKGVYDRGQPLVQMGILIASTLALAIVPLIAHHSQKVKGRTAIPFIRLTFRTAFLFGWAATIGLALVLPFVNEMLFRTRDGSAALIVFSFQIFWLSLILPLTAILQGEGKIKIPTSLLFLGVAVKLIGNVLLVSTYGVLGAAIAGNLGFAVTTGGLLLYFKQIWPIRLAPNRFYGWMAVASVVMVSVLIPWMLLADGWLFDTLSSRMAATLTALSAVMIGATLFLGVVLRSRIMAEKEWYLLPFGKRLAVLQLALHQRKR